MTHKLNTDKTALVATDFHWREIDDTVPLGVKLLLINRNAGIATQGHYLNNGYWTHYAPLPTFPKDET